MTHFWLRILTAALIFAPNAMALPLITGAKRIDLPATFTSDYDFEGIADLGNCSGSLVQLEGAPATDFALILTNGHCIGRFIPPGQFIYGRASGKTFRVFNAQKQLKSGFTATHLVYATMTKTDMAIYRLNQTYEQIKRATGIRPLVLSSLRAGVSQPIEVVSGYWGRGYRCNIEAFIYALKEGDWTFSDSIRYSRPGCEVIGGTSGSPVVAAGTRTVIGVNNTGNDSGERCTENNPCEISEDGDVSWQEGYSYGQQTHWIYSCLNQQREIDLSIPGCELPH